MIQSIVIQISQLKFTNCNHTSKAFYQGPQGNTFLDEVQETMIISEFTKYGGSNCDVEISDEIISDLREYVSLIARMYHRNPFHNFEHGKFPTLQYPYCYFCNLIFLLWIFDISMFCRFDST